MARDRRRCMGTSRMGASAVDGLRHGCAQELADTAPAGPRVSPPPPVYSCFPIKGRSLHIASPLPRPFPYPLYLVPDHRALQLPLPPHPSLRHRCFLSSWTLSLRRVSIWSSTTCSTTRCRRRLSS